MTVQNQWKTAKAVLQGKFIFLIVNWKKKWGQKSMLRIKKVMLRIKMTKINSRYNNRKKLMSENQGNKKE